MGYQLLQAYEKDATEVNRFAIEVSKSLEECHYVGKPNYINGKGLNRRLFRAAIFTADSNLYMVRVDQTNEIIALMITSKPAHLKTGYEILQFCIQATPIPLFSKCDHIGKGERLPRVLLTSDSERPELSDIFGFSKVLEVSFLEGSTYSYDCLKGAETSK